MRTPSTKKQAPGRGGAWGLCGRIVASRGFLPGVMFMWILYLTYGPR